LLWPFPFFSSLLSFFLHMYRINLSLFLYFIFSIFSPSSHPRTNPAARRPRRPRASAHAPPAPPPASCLQAAHAPPAPPPASSSFRQRSIRGRRELRRPGTERGMSACTSAAAIGGDAGGERRRRPGR
jgi:hypothetical protein